MTEEQFKQYEMARAKLVEAALAFDSAEQGYRDWLNRRVDVIVEVVAKSRHPERISRRFLHEKRRKYDAMVLPAREHLADTVLEYRIAISALVDASTPGLTDVATRLAHAAKE